MFGFVLQISTVICSLLTTWLLSRKGKEKWGYLVGLCTIPSWILMELFYRQYFFCSLNPIYIVLWWRGVVGHWGLNEKWDVINYIIRKSS
jgi:hypothetical protein